MVRSKQDFVLMGARFHAYMLQDFKVISQWSIPLNRTTVEEQQLTQDFATLIRNKACHSSVKTKPYFYGFSGFTQVYKVISQWSIPF